MHEANVEQGVGRSGAHLGVLTIVLALQILPFSDIMAKYLALSVPVIQVIWGRFFFHCIATGIYSSVAYGPRYLKPTLSKMLLLRSAALFAAVGLFYVTIHYLPLTTSLTLWFVEPFILTLMAAVILKERVTRLQWVAIAVGFIGILIAVRPTFVALHWSYGTGLLAGFFYALFLFLTRFIDAKVPSVVSVYHTGLVGGVIASLAVAPVWVSPSGEQWILLVATGIIAAVAHLLIIKSFEWSNASTIAPFTYTEVVMGAILGYVVFNDAPDAYLFAGLAIIVASGIALLRAKHDE
ncbi:MULTISPECIES: DMT family transporter [unclassified Bradyrhizobium]|uniref:DMT family transporter n=1 Tax=Bradyrhizobium TaxID=374 RepID=UPI002342A183|nr:MULTISPECIES: DMT family transporter [unclassified Bradyrhizobium]GLH80067.1 permease [Bradyrhizobium sp. SSBR45G]GLH87624.1 permease [Bradyrhizobium sp. SSBR45R]